MAPPLGHARLAPARVLWGQRIHFPAIYGGINIKRKQLNIDWSRTTKKTDIQPALRKFRRHLEANGFRESTIEGYVFRSGKYLEFAQTDHPTPEEHSRFREHLISKKLSRSTLNNFGFSARKYHEMIGYPATFKFIKPDNCIPHYFTEEDVSRIFNACHNLKHLAMLTTMFYECLRVSELCALNDDDIDFEAMTLRVRDKGGREDMVPLNSKVAAILKEYLLIRPPIEVSGEHPVFITDYLNRWHRSEVHRVLCIYKKKAGITKPGGVHVFGRHSPASIMIKNGCDILTIKELMRHRDKKTTSRYLHISDQVKREKHAQYLTL
ncbi:MAG: tyrosine-type recombinase/integrase [Methanotrichaceae archaeon]|nr:tyrosine-type recombinase/integrase [Methanotrichaceae archaeon]